MCEIYPLDPVYRKMVVDQYLVFYQVNDYARTVEIHRIPVSYTHLDVYKRQVSALTHISKGFR